MDAPGIDEGWVGNAFITSNAPIGAIAERYKVETEMLLTNVSRPVINGGNGGPQTTSYAPLVFQNYNFWNTGISVANLDDNNSNTVTVSYFTPGGSQVGTEQLTIPPRGMEFVFTPGSQNLGLDGNIGAAVISGTTSLQAAVDQVKYFGGDEEVGDAMSYVTDHDPADSDEILALPLVQKGNPATGLGDTSGVQFFNPQPATSASFDVDFYDTTGNLVAPTLNTSLSFSLSGHQGVTVYTHNYSEMPAGFQGSLIADVTSGELTAVSNNVNYAVQNDGAAAFNLVTLQPTPAERASILDLQPDDALVQIGEDYTLEATVTDGTSGVPGAVVIFESNGSELGFAITDSNGVASLTYTSQQTGEFDLSAYVFGNPAASDSAEVTWYATQSMFGGTSRQHSPPALQDERVAWTLLSDVVGDDLTTFATGPDVAGTNGSTLNERRTWRLVLNDYGFDIPAGADVTGVEVTMYKSASGPGVVDWWAGLVSNTDPIPNSAGSPYADTTTHWSTELQSVTYGGMFDLMGIDQWAGLSAHGNSIPQFINSGNFGTTIGAQNNSTGALDVNVAAIEVTVYYR
jgi:hypothetical protein